MFVGYRRAETRSDHQNEQIHFRCVDIYSCNLLHFRYNIGILLYWIDFHLKLSFYLGLPAAPNPRIVGGGKAEPGQFPYVVSITENDKHFCGGFIYGPKWIVTAASCVSGYSE